MRICIGAIDALIPSSPFPCSNWENPRNTMGFCSLDMVWFDLVWWQHMCLYSCCNTILFLKFGIILYVVIVSVFYWMVIIFILDRYLWNFKLVTLIVVRGIYLWLINMNLHQLSYLLLTYLLSSRWLNITWTYKDNQSSTRYQWVFLLCIMILRGTEM